MTERFGKNQAIARYVFAFVVIVVGIVMNYLEVGKEFLGFESVGNWLIFVGFLMLVVVTITWMRNKKRIVDERMEKIAYRASRITFLFVIFGAFIIMVWDGVKTIEVPYAMFMSQFVAWMLLVYFVSYKILERYY